MNKDLRDKLRNEHDAPVIAMLSILIDNFRDLGGLRSNLCTAFYLLSNYEYYKSIILLYLASHADNEAISDECISAVKECLASVNTFLPCFFIGCSFTRLLLNKSSPDIQERVNNAQVTDKYEVTKERVHTKDNLQFPGNLTAYDNQPARSWSLDSNPDTYKNSEIFAAMYKGCDCKISQKNEFFVSVKGAEKGVQLKSWICLHREQTLIPQAIKIKFLYICI